MPLTIPSAIAIKMICPTDSTPHPEKANSVLPLFMISENKLIRAEITAKAIPQKMSFFKLFF